MQNSQSSEIKKILIPTPAYIVYEDRVRKNLELLKRIGEESDIKIIMALKANALWKTFPIVKEYFSSSTASSINEMKLSSDYLGKDIHAYCPVYTGETFPQFLDGCTHITFNSLSQFERYYPLAQKFENETGKHVSLGLRVNPKCSVIEHEIYNPAVPGSRFGVSIDKMPELLPHGLEGLHFHSLCESGAEDLQRVLEAFEKDYGKYLDTVKWVNFGGGHLITREGYNVDLFKDIIREFKKRHPHLEIIIEPGSAFMWQTGDLKVKVLDIVEDEGIKTAIFDASFACHMPDCLEMPYKPKIAEALPEEDESGYEYRLGGNTCLTGDYVGTWKFEKPLKEGDILTLLDMNHYTTVKTNMFNGVSHPSIWLINSSGEPVLLKEFKYEDYRDRMS